LVGEANATANPKTLGKRKIKTSPPRIRVLDIADLVIHGYAFSGPSITTNS
jgi:hypothetical protein